MTTRTRIAQFAAVAMLLPIAPAAGQRPAARTGIDVLARDGFTALRGRQVGLITNHTGVAADGATTVELLQRALGARLVVLFSPEHGIAGKLDREGIGDSRDPASGLRIYSLYGATRRPTREQLRDIDTLVFDIQDIGARFYTYISTLGEALVAASEHRLRFVVLDRPNPIGGATVGGPVLDQGKESFVGWHRIAVRHGMTVGELARMFAAERKLKVDLHIVKCEGWKRSDRFDATGLAWIDPSPNMRSLSAALLYPGVGLLETTNISVGRGTRTPFEIVGAPWIDGRRWAAELATEKLDGVTFVPVVFTPQASKFQGEKCGGVRIFLTNWDRFDPIRCGWGLAGTLRRLYPRDWDTTGYGRLLGSEKVLLAVRAGRSINEIERLYQDELAEFKKRREAFLLYP
jgi:uncharacterized protein YbbC (DUF1343 family)